MATPQRRRAENVAGEFYVDDTCIDCDTCRWMAPEVFHRAGEQSAVHAQPADARGRRRALHALAACPTASIGTDPPARDVAQAVQDFPLPVTHNGEVLDDVYHCGFHHRDSFGAASYLLTTPAGNVLVDSPRFATPLVHRLAAMGGVDWIVLTHRDDVADHDRFARHFSAKRVIHAADADAAPGAEALLEGEEATELLPGLQAIPVPGHTRGHVVYLWDDNVLFTGDHLAWSDRRGRLVAFRGANWYSWPKTVRSMERLQDWRFEWVLPGHGHRIHLPAARMQEELARCVAWMRSVA